MRSKNLWSCINISYHKKCLNFQYLTKQQMWSQSYEIVATSMKIGLLAMGRVCLTIIMIVKWSERGFYIIERGPTFIVFWMNIRKNLAPLRLRFGRGLSSLSLNNSQSSKKESVRASKLLPISSFLPFFSQFGIQFHYQKIYNRLNFQLI